MVGEVTLPPHEKYIYIYEGTVEQHDNALLHELIPLLLPPQKQITQRIPKRNNTQQTRPRYATNRQHVQTDSLLWDKCYTELRREKKKKKDDAPGFRSLVD